MLMNRLSVVWINRHDPSSFALVYTTSFTWMPLSWLDSIALSCYG
jgi:hypothetical protein